jgi:aspartyl-tRNA(Asn)/glutamyl-tRNA(Gln) amidotransferase subunit C
MLTREDVEEIAHLARLELSSDEVEAMRGELSTILDHIEALKQVDTAGVEPMTHAVPMDLRLRADEPGTSLPVDTALAGAPATQDDCFQVPHIIKSGS